MLVKVIRLGKDAETRFTQGGDPVTTIVGAYNYGRKGQDGKRPSQWLDLALWGKRGESLAQYLTKGSQVVVTVDDLHIETYESQKGTGSKLVGKVVEIELISSSGAQNANQAPQPAKQPAKQPIGQGGGTIDDFMDDKIPFAPYEKHLY